ncbi:TPA: hypothetical protein DD449_02515 [Candidatus Berkelbacteria bacterium]|nr:hypothetical protein [Candidatus Berkelbacteria bacterium]
MKIFNAINRFAINNADLTVVVFSWLFSMSAVAVFAPAENRLIGLLVIGLSGLSVFICLGSFFINAKTTKNNCTAKSDNKNANGCTGSGCKNSNSSHD